MNLVLVIIPLVNVVFGTMYLYSAREFTELLLAQPVARRSLFAGLYLGLTVPLSLAFVAGVGAPVLFEGAADASTRGTLGMLLLTGVVLTAIFTAIAFVIALHWDDRVKGLGVAIATWLACAVLYDGLVLLLATLFADRPLERPLLVLMLANPVDLARVLLLLQLDLGALLGYTGAVLKHFVGSAGGMAGAVAALLLWTAAPVAVGMRAFRRKDF
jgi:Cu-processing system permease protein